MASKKMDSIVRKTKESISKSERAQTLLSEVKTKLERIKDSSEERSTFIYQILVVVRMLKAHFNHEYKAFSTTTIFTLVFGLVYFITPIDLIPDFIPVLGFTDDISLLFMIFKNLALDISNFIDWEKGEVSEQHAD
ncbi:MAG: uncharacterized membrane protein YkvA (DUF1232 family) [Marinoscillum sp.]|jgi:uncharacterized membrane protein YkvA (DUF1232 family)